MANWNLPTITSQYIDFVTEMNDKIADAGTLSESPTNQPEKYIRYNRSNNLFQEWVAGNWQDKVLGIAGGGTGSTTASGIRTNLGLGSMSTQNSNAVNITGGSITGVNFDANNITGGIVALARGGTGSSLVLGPYGYVLMSTGTQVAFLSGVNITNLNASALETGTISAARLPTNVVLKDADNILSGNTTFTGSFGIQGVNPYILFAETDQSTPYKRLITDSDQFLFQFLANDAITPTLTGLYITRSGIVVGNTGTGAIYGDGVGIVNINGSNITGGIVLPQFLGSGTPNSGNFLRGDGVWAVPSTGGTGGTPIPSGMIAMFDTSCPAGWTRFTQMDNRFPLGSGGAGSVGGSSSHGHNFGGNTDGAGSHSHGFSGSGGLSGARTQGNVTGFTAGPSGGVQTADAGASFQTNVTSHTHGVNITIDLPVNGGSVSIAGSTDGVGNHAHSYSGATDTRDHTPPYYSLVFCRKD